MQDSQAKTFEGELYHMFESARAIVASSLEAAGVPLLVTVDRVVVKDDAEGGSRSVLETAQENAFKQKARSAEVLAALQPWAPRAHHLAVRLARAFGESLPPTPFLGMRGVGLIEDRWFDSTESDSVSEVLTRFVLLPTNAYLNGLPTLATSQPHRARQLAHEVLAILTTGECVIRQFVPLADLKLAAEFTRGSSRVRALSPVERGEFVEPHLASVGLRYASVLAGGLLTVPGYELEVDTITHDVRLFSVLPPPDLLLALELHQVPIVGPGVMASRIVPEWYSVGVVTRPISMRRSSFENTPHDVTYEQFESACSTADRLARFRIDDPQRPSELALRRFNLGCGRQDAADALVDFVIALEALLLPYDSTTRRADMTYRFRMHGAHFISAMPGERATLYDQLRDLYDMRSRLVHGDRYPRNDEIRAAEQLARAIASRGLLKAVHEGFPDVVYFRRALLGEERATPL